MKNDLTSLHPFYGLNEAADTVRESLKNQTSITVDREVFEQAREASAVARHWQPQACAAHMAGRIGECVHHFDDEGNLHFERWVPHATGHTSDIQIDEFAHKPFRQPSPPEIQMSTFARDLPEPTSGEIAGL